MSARVAKMLCAFVVASFVTLSGSFATASEPTETTACDTAASMQGASTTCEYTGNSLREKASTDPEAVYEVFQACWSGESTQPELCNNPRACTVGDETGAIYAVLRDGVYIGTACLTAGEDKVFTPPIAVMVAKRFKSLEWPKSTLTVQPPGGKTLVNFETIFYTTNNQPTTQVVTLLKQTVEIEATPMSYTWHYGDGTSATTSSAGKPHPHQDVVHTYTGLDPVAPSVDTVYSGRFRVNGGPWENIEATVTVEGEAVDLEIMEAIPELVTDPNEP